MIQIRTQHLTQPEINLLRRFGGFVLSRFISSAQIKKLKIKILIAYPFELEDPEDGKDLKQIKAWVSQTKKETFEIVINAQEMNKKAKKIRIRLKNIFMDLAHELVHVKQYLNGEMKDYSDGSVRFMGKKYSSFEMDDQLYFDFPGEIEAYGREVGLYEMFWASNSRWYSAKIA